MQIYSVGASVISPRNQVAKPFAQSKEAEKLHLVLSNLESQRIMRSGLAVRESIETLQKTLRIRSTSQVQSSAGLARSSKSFSLDPQASAATLQSTRQINTETTDYAPTNPLWSGSSTALPVLSGLYNGAQGSGTLTFTVTDLGRRGANDAEVQVTGPLGEFVADIFIDRSDPIEQAYDLGNGLSVTFDGQRWSRDDTAVVSLFTDLNQLVDPNIAFNADPNFETGVSVVAGSFEVNGETINVAADDTLQGVLVSINASEAGVFAAYDSATELITLTQETPGASPTIVVSNDTSGFLSATQLLSATVTPGSDPDSDSSISLVPNLSSVTAGELLVNGISIVLDPSTQSVQDVLTTINNAGAGAYARLVRDSILVINSTNGEDLSLDSNGTNFFEALNVASDVYAGQQGRNGTSSKQLLRVYEDTRDLTRNLNTLFDTPEYAPQSTALQNLKEEIAALMQGSISDLKGLGIDLRLDIKNDSETLKLKLPDSPLSFRNAIRGRLEDLQNEFIGTDLRNREGLLGELLKTLESSLFGSVRKGNLIDAIV